MGDDLTEEVLQYLTFSDKVRLECVSKQWQRCVFEKSFVIEYTEQYVNECHSESFQTTLNNLIQTKALNYRIYGSVFNRPALECCKSVRICLSKVILCFLSNCSNIRNLII